MNCLHCGEPGLDRDAVDVGVGIIYGPYGCHICGWSEAEEYDFSGDKKRLQPDGSYIDQWGGLHPAGSSMAKAHRLTEGKEELTGWRW